MRKKADPVNIILAALFVLVVAAVFVLGGRIKQAVVTGPPAAVEKR